MRYKEMTINQLLLYIMACGALLGGADRLLGNRFGLGGEFEKGFQMLGPVALSMAGILCLSPVLSSLLGLLARPVGSFLHMDPGIWGSILAIDMGGLQLSVDLAEDPALGLFSGVVLSSIFGCTLVFSIPVGMGFLKEAGRPYFTKGILLGLATMPVSILVAAGMLRLSLGYVLWNCLPVLLLSALLAVGVLRKPEAMGRVFQGFAGLIQGIAIFGLTLGAIAHLTQLPFLESLLPLQEAMDTVTAICIVMLGSMPLAELIQRLLQGPFEKISTVTGLDSAAYTALLLGLFSATPALALLPQMNRRGQVVVSAFLVSGVCVFGAHFAYADSTYPEMVPAMLAAKLVGGLLGGMIAMAATRNLK